MMRNDETTASASLLGADVSLLPFRYVLTRLDVINHACYRLMNFMWTCVVVARNLLHSVGWE